MPDYSNFDPLVENIQELVLKAEVIYKNHQRILTIGICVKSESKIGSHPSIFTVGEVCDTLKFLFGVLIKMEL